MSEIERTKEMTLGSFVDKLSIDLVGEKAVKKLGITTVEQFLDWQDETFVIGENIKKYVAENKNYIYQLLKVVKIKKEVEAKVGAKHIAMTGAGPDTRNNLIARIVANGDVFDSSPNKETNILLCEDPDSGSSKLAKAEKLGIKIMRYGVYFK
jgi:NAD-dependent DNA ligase